jgi:hypothetical protein
MNKATEKQINYIKILVEQTGTDAPDYSTLDKDQASKLIGDLKTQKETRKAQTTIAFQKLMAKKLRWKNCTNNTPP